MLCCHWYCTLKALEANIFLAKRVLLQSVPLFCTFLQKTSTFVRLLGKSLGTSFQGTETKSLLWASSRLSGRDWSAYSTKSRTGMLCFLHLSVFSQSLEFFLGRYADFFCQSYRQEIPTLVVTTLNTYPTYLVRGIDLDYPNFHFVLARFFQLSGYQPDCKYCSHCCGSSSCLRI